MALEAGHNSGIFVPQTILSRSDFANVQNSGHVSVAPPTVNDFRGPCDPSLFGGDSAFQSRQQQFDIARFISQHKERVRIEYQQHRERYSRKMVQAAEIVIRRRLKSKDEELVKMGKSNLALTARVKSLTAQNRKWRDVARRSEAATEALRRDLKQALEERQLRQAAAEEDDARSHCGSNYLDDDGREETAARDQHARVCRWCEREESCVLLLPCRHLCLCAVCGSRTHACPVCRSIKTASVHVNL